MDVEVPQPGGLSVQPPLLLDYELAVSQSGYIVRALLKLEGKVPDAGARIRLDLALVLDHSGSMAGEKLTTAREAAALAVRRLRLEDVVSVVAYDDEVITVAPPPAMGAEQGALPAQILAITAGGMTNLSGGWLRGHELAAEVRRRALRERVALRDDAVDLEDGGWRRRAADGGGGPAGDGAAVRYRDGELGGREVPGAGGVQRAPEEGGVCEDAAADGEGVVRSCTRCR
jgi:hypothetical protein